MKLEFPDSFKSYSVQEFNFDLNNLNFSFLKFTNHFLSIIICRITSLYESGFNLTFYPKIFANLLAAEYDGYGDFDYEEVN